MTLPPHPGPRVLSVGADTEHRFSKPPRASIRLVEGLGVDGDAHCGTTVQHRSRVARDPSQPNLRQVHLIQTELFAEVAGHGHRLAPGDLGENVSTTGVDLLGLPVGALLQLGADAQVRITGLRNPCWQIDRFSDGLLPLMLPRDDQGRVFRKAGVMAVVVRSGQVRPGDPVRVVLPPPPHLPLAVV
ncbi:MAG TPA: MOSC domain-containing protein [Nocardioidaceae bacterium]|nr:MOSC domain-containing protein [Nocardioidaceae bacterium]